MWSVFLLIGIAFLLGLLAWGAFLWAVRSGQYDDAEGPKYRMLDEEDRSSSGEEDGDEEVRRS